MTQKQQPSIHENRSAADHRLSELLRDNIPDAPLDPWFTRKVLNRLDSRKRRVAALIERFIYIIGIATTAVVAIRISREIMSSSSPVSLQQGSALMILAGLSAAMIYALVEPLTVRRKIKK